MCTEIRIDHICGHKHTRKPFRCSQNILHKLDLSTSPASDDKDECACGTEISQLYLKPDLCEACIDVGVIGAFLEQDPSRRYQMVRVWHETRRIMRPQHLKYTNEQCESQRQTLDHDSELSDSSYTSDSPKTPLIETDPSKVKITNLADDSSVERLEFLSPLAATFNIAAEATDQKVDCTDCEIALAEPTSDPQGEREDGKAINLGTRVCSLRQRVVMLIAKNKEHNSARA